MDEHIVCLLDLSHQITSSGEKLDDLHLTQAMVLSLPKTPSWELVKIPLFELAMLTSELVSTRLLQEANRCTREKNGTDTALYVQGGKGKGKPRTPGKAKPSDECRRCGEKGHWVRDCKKPEGESKKASGSSAHLAVSTLQELGTQEVGQLYVVTDGSEKRSDVLLDCAATSHMFHDRQIFMRYTRSAPGDAISVGDGKEIPVSRRGTISIRCRLPNGVQTVILHEALHIPDLTANLVSLGQLERLGVIGSFGGGCIKLSIGGDELFEARLLSINLYRIDTVACDGSGVAYIAESSGSLRLWHRRMGHLHLDAIRKLASKRMVEGLTISSLQDYDRVCEGCALGKSHRLPFLKISTTEHPKMGLLVVDLTGPMSVETWSGMLYASVVVEASCRFGSGDLLALKDDAYGMLTRTVTRLERQSGEKCQIIQSDNSNEFVNQLVERFCVKNGIIHQTTLPYTPQQNGIAERAIVVYFDMVRCMLHSSGMDLRYWGEAFMYAVHIRNLSPTSGLVDQVPYTAWTGRRPDVSHLRVFGSVGYVNIPKKVRGGKLAVTSVKCRLLGWWADETKGYHLEDMETKKIVSSHDVTFIEDTMLNDLAIIEGEVPRLTELNSEDLEALSKAPDNADSTENVATGATTANENPDGVEELPPPALKPSKWANLPPHEPSSRNQ
jgi:hypothetical protein